MKRILTLFFTMCWFAHLISDDIDWGTPMTISTTGQTASDPHIVIDASGNATAAWIENNFVKASSQPVGGSWDLLPSTLSNSGVSSVRLGIDSSGNVTALWVENGVVSSATLPFGGNWSAETAVSASGATSPQLAVDATGNAVAVWVRNGYIESSTKLAGGGLWSLIAQLSNNSSDSPSVAIGDGTVVAVWHSIIAAANTIVSATMPIGGTWNTAVNVISVVPAFTHNFPKVVVDANGNATALWLRYTLSNGIYQDITILSSTLTSGSSSWSAIPTGLTTGGMAVSLNNIVTRIGCDTNGNVIAVWTMSYDGYDYNIESAVQQVGQNWSGSVGLQLENIYGYEVDLAVNNALGDALATYMIFDEVSSVTITAQESDIGGPVVDFWSYPLTMSQGSNNGFPRVASSLSGNTINAVTVWINFDGTSNVIQASTGSKTTLLPPTNLAVIQGSNNFQVFDEYYNMISWDASTSPDLIQYNIYRNGIYFASVDSSLLEFIDHNAVQNGSVTYGISAEDSARGQSPTATINFP